MSDFSVNVVRIEDILPIKNADLIELAKIGGYFSIVAKNKYKAGDYAIYIPEQSVLCDSLIEEIGLAGKLSGSKKNRVKAIKLRGELSQGIICRPQWFTDWTFDWDNHILMQNMVDLEEDFAKDLGIVKYEVPIPVHMQGKLGNCRWLIPWGDIQNIKKYPEIFNEDDVIIATEKIHGTNLGITYDLLKDEVAVYSKGLGAKYINIEPSDETYYVDNVYWIAVQEYSLDTKLQNLCKTIGAYKVALFGEVYGSGIQDLSYAGESNKKLFAAFDIYVEHPDFGAGYWDFANTLRTLKALGIPTVPMLYHGIYNYDVLTSLSSGKETVSGNGAHIREGLVVRPEKEGVWGKQNRRKIAKFVSPEYLTRKNPDATEFE